MDEDAEWEGFQIHQRGNWRHLHPWFWKTAEGNRGFAPWFSRGFGMSRKWRMDVLLVLEVGFGGRLVLEVGFGGRFPSVFARETNLWPLEKGPVRRRSCFQYPEVGFLWFLQEKPTSGPGRRFVSLAKTQENQPPKPTSKTNLPRGKAPKTQRTSNRKTNLDSLLIGETERNSG